MASHGEAGMLASGGEEAGGVNDLRAGVVDARGTEVEASRQFAFNVIDVMGETNGSRDMFLRRAATGVSVEFNGEVGHGMDSIAGPACYAIAAG